MRFIVDLYSQIMGWDLPERKLQLNFRLPTVRHAATPGLTELYHLNKLRSNSEQDFQLLRQLLLKLRQLNRCNLSIKRRLQLNENLVGLFYAPAKELVVQFSSDGGLPDSEQREQYLECIINICSALINSYKVILSYLHNCSSFRYARSLAQADMSAFRILDLLRLKQKVKGLRYQQLSEEAWQTANTVIHMMLAAGRAAKPMLLLERKYIKTCQLPTMHMRDMFAALQMSQRFHLLKWPVQWQVLLDHSIGLGDLKLEIAVDTDLPLTKQQSLVYCYDKMPTQWQRLPGSTPALILNWEKLHQTITNDFSHVLRARKDADPSKISKHLSLFSPVERLALAQ
ncbi:hypothetical protein BH11PSE12_BH11PSE12_02040 [soil metagenome]